MMLICTSVPRPTEPGLRSSGGSGLDAIWCAASVMPYASSTGAPNAVSRACITAGGSDALHERMKRRRSVPAGRRDESPGSAARASSNWCSVGTAEYHVTPWSRATRQNDSGLNFAGTTTVPPVASVASVEATRPCTWNNGITHNATSSAVSA